MGLNEILINLRQNKFMQKLNLSKNNFVGKGYHFANFLKDNRGLIEINFNNCELSIISINIYIY